MLLEKNWPEKTLPNPFKREWENGETCAAGAFPHKSLPPLKPWKRSCQIHVARYHRSVVPFSLQGGLHARSTPEWVCSSTPVLLGFWKTFRMSVGLISTPSRLCPNYNIFGLRRRILLCSTILMYFAALFNYHMTFPPVPYRQNDSSCSKSAYSSSLSSSPPFSSSDSTRSSLRSKRAVVKLKKT